MTPLLIAGDGGGTKTDVGIYSLAGGPGVPLVRKEFASRRYPTLAAMVRDFFAMADYQVDRGCFAVAGPVLRGRAHSPTGPGSLTRWAWPRSSGSDLCACSMTGRRSPVLCRHSGPRISTP
jgi:hypothetical protein